MGPCRLFRFLASWCLLGLAFALELHAASPVLEGVPAPRLVLAPGASTTLTVTATGNGPLTYRWKHEGRLIANATSPTLALSAVTYAQAGAYVAEVTDIDGDTSRAVSFIQIPRPAGATRIFSGDIGDFHAVVLRDASADVLPVPVVTPLAATILSGQTSTFTVTVDAAAGLCSYQWRKDGVALTGQTNPTLIASASGTYAVAVTNAVGTALSAAASLTVIPPPALSATVPSRQVITPGQTATVSVTATGNGPFTYRWKHQGRVLPEATDSTLSRPSFSAAAAGPYVAEVTDANGLVSRAIFHLVPATTGSGLVAWGNNSFGQLNPTPPVMDDIWTVAAGGQHALALRTNGQVYSWGAINGFPTTVPTGLSEVVAIAAGRTYSLALRADGNVLSWGGSFPPAVGTTTDIVGIAAGTYSALAIKADGTVLPLGRDLRPVPPGLSEVVAVAAGASHALALSADGSVTSWGTFEFYNASTVPSDIGQVVAVAAGDNHALALRTDGTVVAWGQNTQGQINVPAGLRGVVAISAHGNLSLARLADGTVIAWGNNSSGQATPPAALQNVRAASAGGTFSLALRDASLDGVPSVSASVSTIYVTLGAAADLPVVSSGGNLVFTWTKNGETLPATTGPTHRLRPARAADSGSYSVTVTNSSGTATSLPFAVEVLPPPSVTLAGPVRVVLAPGDSLALSATASGHGPLTFRWYKDGILLPGTSPSFSLPALAVTHTGRYEVEVTDTHGGGQARAFVWVFVSPPQQQVVVWGDFTSIVPPDIGRVIQVSAGTRFTLALRANGTVAVWGPLAAALGPIPEDVRDVVAIAAGSAHCLALLADGTLRVWGDNSGGQLTVLTVPTDGPFIAIAADISHALALRASGTAVIWGGSATLPVPGRLRDIIAVTTSRTHSLALMRDGTVASWDTGNAYFSPPFTTPLGPTISSWRGIVAIEAGDDVSAGLRADGTALIRTSSQDLPQPPPLGSIVSILLSPTSIEMVALARRRNGTVDSWMINTRGSVRNSLTNLETPPTFRDVAVLAVNWSHGVLVRDASADQMPFFSTTPTSQRVAVGTAVTFTAAAPDAIYYRWYRNGTELVAPIHQFGGFAYITNNRATLTFRAGHVSLNQVEYAEGDYTVHAVNGAGEVASASFRLDFTENFAAWRIRGFTSTERNNSAVSGPLGVSGPDAEPNLLKYALGISARSPLGTPGELFSEGAAWGFIYERPSDRPDVIYAVETSTDLQTWTTEGVQHLRLAPPENGWETWRAHVPGEVPRRFYQLRVSQP